MVLKKEINLADRIFNYIKASLVLPCISGHPMASQLHHIVTLVPYAKPGLRCSKQHQNYKVIKYIETVGVN